MRKYLYFMVAIFGGLPAIVIGAEPVPLSETTYNADLGILIVQVNWGRRWKCGGYENVQLQALNFTKSPVDASNPVSLDLETPSKLFVDNTYLPYAFVIRPSEYVLTAFDVKVAR